MTEELKTHEKNVPNYEELTLPDANHAEKLRQGEPDPEKSPHEAIAEAREDVVETIEANKQLNPMDKIAAELAPPAAVERKQIGSDMKKAGYNREMTNIRRNLPRPQRALSKLVHQPVVRVVSELAGKTVSRPSGLLGGGLVAFLGTSAYLGLAKHIGFRYNYAIFLVLFVGGFVIGLGLELLVHLATAGRRKAID